MRERQPQSDLVTASHEVESEVELAPVLVSGVSRPSCSFRWGTGECHGFG